MTFYDDTLGQQIISVLFLLFTVLFGLSLPFCCYLIYQFRSFRDDKRFRKRHGNLSVYISLTFVGELFSGCLLTLAFSGFINNDDVNTVMAWVGDVLNLICYFVSIHCLLLRFWALYYDIRYQVAIKENVWKSLIDANLSVNDEHLSQVSKFDITNDLWFINKKNKDTWGNTKYMAKVIFSSSFVMVMLATACLIAIELSVPQLGLTRRRGIIEIVFTVLFTLPWLCLMFIYHKTPTFHDSYHLKTEMVIVHNLDVVDVLSSMVASIVANFAVYSATSGSYVVNTDPTINVVILASFYLMGVSHIALIYVMTKWVTHKIIAEHLHIQSLHAHLNQQKKAQKTTDFKQILQHDIGYEVFMEHLVSEFCSELLLSLTEFTQFKQLVKSENGLDGELQVEFPEHSIPKSSIVSGSYDGGTAVHKHSLCKTVNNSTELAEQMQTADEQHMQRYGCIVYLLYQKYIRSGSPHQVNLSFAMQTGIESVMDHANKTTHAKISIAIVDYFQFFDECIAEILRLLRYDSFLRFISTPAFKDLQEEMHL
eukprot:CAMPEP_0202732892 /NCGR_PEP_ID=MMETSP1385-20130828/187891_1 /ASSEMBLY_ACC=CAM_ASM_000861 /TAXON_ID=933848 /ORGANISM="Elphidium margaritaceum" /LENGTH=538 /DNA_ID=CAMNT_0049399215 /DNA_START=41 /DNA_END=1657 /DNA_ORIENTATION=-